MITACGIMHPRCCRPVAWKRNSSTSRLLAGNTQSSAPGDGQNNCPKHVELTGITVWFMTLFINNIDNQLDATITVY